MAGKNLRNDKIQVNLCQKLLFFASTKTQYNSRFQLQVQTETWGEHVGGFQSLDLIITELKSHMCC